MNKIIVLVLACYVPLVVAATKIVAPNMELGHWVTTADTSAILEDMLKKIPKENRAMMRKVMEEKMQKSGTTEECITKESLANFDQQVKDAFGDRKKCKYNITESTSEKFAATLNCAGSVMDIKTNVINSKRNETTVVSNVFGGGKTEVKSVAEWKSSVCPEGL